MYEISQVCDYFDDEIDDQPDLTLNENDQSYRGTPATEFPPTNFNNLLNKSTKIVKQDGGESDARDLANELFIAKVKAETEEANKKEASLNASLESLEHDDVEK